MPAGAEGGCVMLPADTLCNMRLLCLDGPLAKAEPNTLRYRLVHTARLSRSRPSQ
jgi:hypothetical protein